MKYNNETIRRQDRLMDENRAMELLQTSEYGIMSMITSDGEPYGIPLNYVYDGKESIYVHCAPKGMKLSAIKNNPKVSFCITGNINIVPDKFTTEYESIILRGTANINLSDEEKMAALRLIIKKLSADFSEIGDKYAEKSFHRVEIIRIDITAFSGKCKYIKK